MSRKKRTWSFSTGRRGQNRVRVFESEPGGILYGEMRDDTLASGYRCVSLSHTDRDLATEWAEDQSAKLQLGQSIVSGHVPTVAKVFSLYRRYQTPKKSVSERDADNRRMEMYTRVLGSKADLRKLGMRELDTFSQARKSGAIDPRGNLVPDPDKRRRVRDGTVAGEITFLTSVINWACKCREDGEYLMRENPIRGYEIAGEKNPRRPVMVERRYMKLREAAPRVTQAVGQGRFRRDVRAPLLEVIDLAYHTGRRIGAILALEWEDLSLSDGPYGKVRWRADVDKMGKEWFAPLNGEARAAVDRLLAERAEREVLTYLFPQVKDASKHVRVDVAASWLQRAEEEAGLEKQDGSLWHAFRRAWATRRKWLPDVDVAQVGGWSDLQSLKTSYQHADEDTMQKVADGPFGK